MIVILTASRYLLLIILLQMSVAKGYARFTRKNSLYSHSRAYMIDKISPVDKNMVPTEIMPTSFSGTGCILLAQPQERDHFLIKGTILITEHGPRGTVGVLIDKATPYSVKETSPGLDLFERNTMFMGGSQGNDMALMIHKHNFGGLTKSLGYGLFIGGMKQAEQALNERTVHPFDFKFVFNSVQWAPGLLEKEIAGGRWDVCVMPPDLVLRQDPREHTPIWAIGRNALNQQKVLIKEQSEEDDY